MLVYHSWHKHKIMTHAPVYSFILHFAASGGDHKARHASAKVGEESINIYLKMDVNNTAFKIYFKL